MKYSDREVEYRSLAEMKQIRDDMRRELNETDTSGSRKKLGVFSKGL